MNRSLFSSALASHWRREVLRTSLWFMPSVEVVAAVGLFIGTLAADRAAYRGDFGLPGWVISGSADAARQILTAIAAAIITVVGVVFSIILVTLTLASTQFGPRMLRNFIRDRGTQVTLGTFVATFVYSVLVLGSVGTGSHGDFVPHISVTTTIALMVIDMAVLIYFIHHTAISIQLPQVIASIAADLTEAIKEQGSGPARTGPEAGPAAVELLSRTEKGGAVLFAPVSGYVQFIRQQNLVRLAARADAVISLEHRPGHFIVRGHRFATVWPPEAAPLVRQAMSRAHIIGPHRTLTQDVSFGIDQLVEIALRALSPAVNDHLHGDDLHRLAGREPVQDRVRLAPGPGAPGRRGLHPGHHGRPGLRPAGAAGVREDQGVQHGHARDHDPRAGSAGAHHDRDDLRRPAPGAARSGGHDRPGQRAVGSPRPPTGPTSGGATRPS